MVEIMTEKIGFKIMQPVYYTSDPDIKKKSVAFRRGLLNVEELPGFERWQIRTSGFDNEFIAWIDEDVDSQEFMRQATVAMGRH
jgi:hypothetical protein